MDTRAALRYWCASAVARSSRVEVGDGRESEERATMRATWEVRDGGGDLVQSAECGASDCAIPAVEDGSHLAMVVMREEPESSDAVNSLVELIEELHRASSEAAAHGFPRMARRLDECGFAFASELADDRSNERALVERARGCLETWRAMREW